MLRNAPLCRDDFVSEIIRWIFIMFVVILMLGETFVDVYSPLNFVLHQLELILLYPEVLTFGTRYPMIYKILTQLRYLKERSNNGSGTNATARYVDKQNKTIVRS